MTANLPTRVLLVDDHTLFRAGVRRLLAARPELEVVAEAGSAEEAFAVLARQPVDVVLMDIGLPGMNGVAALRACARDHPQLKVVVLSMHKDSEYVGQALKAGASGYVLKDCSPEELSVAIQAAMRGQLFISPAVSALVAAPYLERLSDDHVLTPRQLQVLTLLARGWNVKQVAAELGLSTKTIETHRAQLMERLGLRSVAALVMYAIRNGLISADDDQPPPQ